MVKTAVQDKGVDPIRIDRKRASVKKSQLTETDQKQMLVDVLLPRSKLRGKIAVASIPTGTHSLTPPKNEPDAVKEWASDLFHQTHGRTPTNQAYKAACNAVTVTLRSQVAEEEARRFGDNSESISDQISTDNDLPFFRKKKKVDGHDNLYILDDCKIGRVKVTREGEEYSVILWGKDVFPTVHKVCIVHDTYEGQQTQYDLSIAGTRKILPLETFKNGNWIDYFPGITGVLDSSKEKLYKAVIMQVAKDAPKVDSFESTGWKKITFNEIVEWVYLFPDGKFLIRKGAKITSLEVHLIHEILSPQEKDVWKTFQFPDEVPSRERRQAAYDYLKRVAPRGQALITLAHNIGSLLYDFRNATFGPGHSEVMVAPPGEGKTSLAGFIRCIASPYQLRPTPDSTFQNTVTAIEHDLTYRSSMPTIVDDLVWEGANETKRRESALILEQISRAVFNLAPVRKRMSSRMRKQRENYIRTLPVFTVEHIPDMPKSWYRRVFIVEITEGELVKRSDGRADITALDQMDQHVPILQYWGVSAIIPYFLEKVAIHGYEDMVKRFESLYRQANKDIRDALMEKWERDQRGNKLPGDWDSIADSAAYELLYFRVFRMVACCDLKTADSDLFPHLVDTVYQQILRMENRIPDEEGLLIFEKGVLQLFEEISDGKVTNSQRWRVDHKVPATGDEEPPLVYTQPDEDGNPTDHSYHFPRQYWGWIDVEEHEYQPRYQTVAYIDETTIYLTGEARAELLRIIGKLPEGEDITSEKALGDLAEKEGWITKRQKGDLNRRALKITPPQGPKRVWCLSLAKFLAHFETLTASEDASDERASNVTSFPKKEKDHLDDTPYSDPFADENQF